MRARTAAWVKPRDSRLKPKNAGIREAQGNSPLPIHDRAGPLLVQGFQADGSFAAQAWDAQQASVGLQDPLL